jgi:tRNA-splicing ligase RtcB (3'-phosphate/5'-hydroxy nucleic acid ligase)
MQYFKVGEGLVVKSWCNAPEPSAVEQALHLAALPFAFHHVCLMPDTHLGYGMPIGGVMATQRVVVPNAVGVDIGCGVCAVKTSLTEIDLGTLKEVMNQIRSLIPLGMSRHKDPQDVRFMPKVDAPLPVVERQWDKALCQLGTLGGGNHFIEIQRGGDGHIWIMIHSGSRNLGKQVADHYNKVAVAVNEKYFSRIPKEWQLAFLPLDSEEGQSYVEEMNYCVDFAEANRKLMMDRIEGALFQATGCIFYRANDVAHNYAIMEHHFGHNVMVHRKGATSAKQGELGIVPGSQGTASYIVMGLGNPDSFKSCSHGAGRAMGRKEAERTLSLEEEVSRLDRQGIIHSIRSVSDLDEAAGAYKDIDVVMEEQDDLVGVVCKLEPMAVIKG